MVINLIICSVHFENTVFEVVCLPKTSLSLQMNLWVGRESCRMAGVRVCVCARVHVQTCTRAWITIEGRSLSYFSSPSLA